MPVKEDFGETAPVIVARTQKQNSLHLVSLNPSQ
jgi:hypothetical protein